MKIMKLRLFFFIMLFITYFSNFLIVDEKKNKLRRLDGESTSGPNNQNDQSGPNNQNDQSGPNNQNDQSSPNNQNDQSGQNSQNENQNKDEDKYDECEDMIAYDPTECFEIELDFQSNIKKCCFLEYKDKKYENKRRRKCTILTNEEFLDIKKTIKTIKEKNTNYTVLSLECDKYNILSLNIALFLILLLISL